MKASTAALRPIPLPAVAKGPTTLSARVANRCQTVHAVTVISGGIGRVACVLARTVLVCPRNSVPFLVRRRAPSRPSPVLKKPNARPSILFLPASRAFRLLNSVDSLPVPRLQPTVCQVSAKTFRGVCPLLTPISTPLAVVDGAALRVIVPPPLLVTPAGTTEFV